MHRRLRLVQPPVLEDPDVGRGRQPAHRRRPARPAGALDHRLRPREGCRREGVHVRRELPPRRAARRRCSSSRWGASPSQQEERAEHGTLFERMAAEIPGVRVMPHDERITRWSFYNYILAIDPDAFGGRHERDRVRGARGRGHPGRGAVPADEPLRAVPALALAPARSRSSTPTGSTRAACRSRSPRRPACANPSTSWRTSSATATEGSTTPWRRSRRSSGTPPSCRAV